MARRSEQSVRIAPQILGEISGDKNFGKLRADALKLTAGGHTIDAILYNAACDLVDSTIPHEKGIMENWSTREMMDGVRNHMKRQPARPLDEQTHDAMCERYPMSVHHAVGKLMYSIIESDGYTRTLMEKNITPQIMERIGSNAPLTAIQFMLNRIVDALPERERDTFAGESLATVAAKVNEQFNDFKKELGGSISIAG